jgi:Spy/CpxP family protein refolding chaperone
MKMNWMKVAAFAGILALTAMPVAVMADGVSVNFNIGADDQAHFDFHAGQRHYHPMIWKAAKQLQNAKHTLYAAADDFNGHKMDAINAINGALDQLMICAHK